MKRIVYEVLVYICLGILILMYGHIRFGFLRIIPYIVLLSALVILIKGYKKCQ